MGFSDRMLNSATFESTIKKKKKKLHGLSPRANYTDRATAASRRESTIYIYIYIYNVTLENNKDRMNIIKTGIKTLSGMTCLSGELFEAKSRNTRSFRKAILDFMLVYVCNCLLSWVDIPSPCQWTGYVNEAGSIIFYCSLLPFTFHVLPKYVKRWKNHASSLLFKSFCLSWIQISLWY
jgi:hypothetical protein